MGAACSSSNQEVKTQKKSKGQPARKEQEKTTSGNDAEQKPVELHLMRPSVNCHGAWMLLKQAGIKHDIKDVDLMKGEQMSAEYLAMNPLHTVPTLKDDDFSVWESNAIVRYLVNKFDSAKKFYPSDSAMRTHCDIALEWRQNALYGAVSDIAYPILGFGAPNEERIKKALEKFHSEEQDGYFQTFTQFFLNGKKFICGDEPTIADFVIAPCFEFLDVSDDVKFPAAVSEYRKRFYAATNYEEMVEGMGGFGTRQLVTMCRNKKQPEKEVVKEVIQTKPVELHLMRPSVNCHGAWMLLKQAGIKHDIKDVDLMKGEQMSAEYLAMNPLHTVPTLKDDDFSVWESNAIVRYLVNKFDSAKKFYPSDSAMRTHCDIALEWRQNALYGAVSDIAYPILGFGAPNEERIKKALEKFHSEEQDGYFQTFTQFFLNGKKFICGDEPTIADFVIAPCFEFLDVSDDVKFPAAVSEYRKRFYAATNYEEMVEGMGGFGTRQLVTMCRNKKEAEQKPVELHLMRPSVNCHGAWMLLKQAGIKHDIKDVDLMKGEQMSAEYLAMNPLHTVPTLKDDDFSVWESNAIVRYLVNKFDSAKKFYPSDSAMRTHCDIALEWRQNALYGAVSDIAYPILGFGAPNEERIKKALEKFHSEEQDGYFQTFTQFFLNGKKFICGDEPTIADFVIAPCFEFLDVSDDVKFPAAVSEYRKRFYAATNYEEMVEGMGGFGTRQLVAMKRK